MKITDVRIRLVTKEDSKLKAVASITIDECFVVHDIKVIEGKEGYFISMPSKKTPDGEYRDIVHPINTETREKIIEEVLKVYEKAEKELAKQSEALGQMITKNTQGTTVKVVSGFMKPIAGPITSPFGYRVHPVFKKTIFHSV